VKSEKFAAAVFIATSDQMRFAPVTCQQQIFHFSLLPFTLLII
jgi:hypothetical protein